MRRQPSERLKRLDEGKTGFSRWRAHVGLLQDEAAEALGLGLFAIQSYESGRTKPQLGTRALMRLIAEGWKVEPWPE